MHTQVYVLSKHSADKFNILFIHFKRISNSKHIEYFSPNTLSLDVIPFYTKQRNKKSASQKSVLAISNAVENKQQEELTVPERYLFYKHIR